MLKSDKTEIEQISRLPIILLAGAGLRLKKDLPGPKGLAQVGKETILSLQLQRFNNKDFQKPIVVIREEEKFPMRLISHMWDWRQYWLSMKIP